MLDILRGCDHYPAEVCGTPYLLHSCLSSRAERRGRLAAGSAPLRIQRKWLSIGQWQPGELIHRRNKGVMSWCACIPLHLHACRRLQHRRTVFNPEFRNERSDGNFVVRISEIIHSCSEPKKRKNQYSVGVKFLSELGGRLSVRWLSMLVPTGQQLTLIAEHYCCLAQDILRYSYRCALCVCVYMCGFVRMCHRQSLFSWDACATTQRRGDSHRSIRALRLLKVVQISCLGCCPSSIHLWCLSSFPFSLIIIAPFVIAAHTRRLFCAVLPTTLMCIVHHEKSILDLTVLSN